MLNRAAPNYKNYTPLVITLRLPIYPDRSLGERIKEWRLEKLLLQRNLAEKIGVNEMTIVNWEKGTKPAKGSLEKLEAVIGTLHSPPSLGGFELPTY